MFELVEQQPSHLACPDVLNLSLGECGGPRGHVSGAPSCGLCDVLSPSFCFSGCLWPLRFV